MTPPRTLKNMLDRDSKILLLSTYNENAGDDFIRFGVEHILKESGLNGQIGHIAKSNPLSYYSDLFLDSMENRGLLYRLLTRSLREVALNAPFRGKVSGADLFVVAGSPLFYYLAQGDISFRSEHWVRGLLRRRLAGGTHPLCVALGVGSILDNADKVGTASLGAEEWATLREFSARFALVTVRDTATQQLFKAIGRECPLLPCPSIWACNRLGIVPEAAPGANVVFSYSHESASWSSGGPADSRFQLAVDILTELKKEFPIVQVAHNMSDYKAQNRLSDVLGVPRPVLKGSAELLKIISSCRMAVTWRVHASMASTSLGVPCVLFGSDSRSLMASELGVTVMDAYKTSKEAALDAIARTSGQSRNKKLAVVNEYKQQHLRSYVADMEGLLKNRFEAK